MCHCNAVLVNVFSSFILAFLVPFLRMPKSKYHAVPVDEERRVGGAREKQVEWLHPDLDGQPVPGSGLCLRKHWVWLAHAVLLSTSVTFFAVSLCMKGTASTESNFLSRISTYCMNLLDSVIGLSTNTQTAPLFPAVKYEPVKFDLTPIPTASDSPYIGYGPDVDRAWDYIANDSKH